jgi:DNA-binding NtrC family response regulator
MALPKKNGILVVDDNEEIADLVKYQLLKDGYSVHEFYDPLVALDYFKENSKKFALVITDVRMPSMSGIELVSKVKEIKQDVKAILISAFERDTIDDEIDRYNVEIAEIFQKPILLKKLRACVDRHIKTKDVKKEKTGKEHKGDF